MKLGWIPYWNLYPLKKEIVSHIDQRKLTFHCGHPFHVNRWLQEGKVDIAPCSSICLLTQESFNIALPLGVASKGEVHSVYLGAGPEHREFCYQLTKTFDSVRELFDIAYMKFGNDFRSISKYLFQQQKESYFFSLSHEELPPLVLSSASETSNILLRLLITISCGEKVYLAMVQKGQTLQSQTMKPLKLVIGDNALKYSSLFETTYDLGKIWYDLTSLPFVFAVWQQSKKNIDESWKKSIRDLAGLAEKKMRADPHSYYPSRAFLDCFERPVALDQYWRSLHYTLKLQDMQGLLLYLCLAKELLKKPPVYSTLSKLARLENSQSSLENFSL